MNSAKVPTDAKTSTPKRTMTLARLTQMQTSKVVEVDGTFIGAAILLADSQSWRFVAAHPRAQQADGLTAPTLHETQLAARRAYVSARQPENLSA